MTGDMAPWRVKIFVANIYVGDPSKLPISNTSIIFQTPLDLNSMAFMLWVHISYHLWNYHYLSYLGHLPLIAALSNLLLKLVNVHFSGSNDGLSTQG